MRHTKDGGRRTAGRGSPGATSVSVGAFLLVLALMMV
jgi:hypothetical protein